MGLAITKYGVKFFRNGVEVTDGVKITQDRVAVGSACENPRISTPWRRSTFPKG